MEFHILYFSNDLNVMTHRYHLMKEQEEEGKKEEEKRRRRRKEGTQTNNNTCKCWEFLVIG
jgi:hypothetical protein